MIGSFKKLPSDSSASKTAHSPFPSLALFLIELITPPLIIVGSNFDSKRIFETKKEEINLITDSMLAENYIILTKQTQYKDFKKNSDEYMEFKKIAKMNIAEMSRKIFSIKNI